VQGRERQVHLRLHTCGPEHQQAPVSRHLSRGHQQCQLPDARLPRYYQRTAAVANALEKAGDHVRFTVAADQPDPGHAVPRNHVWRDVLSQVITVPLRDAVVVVVGEYLLRLSSGEGGTH
jgi:hypothetical protein